MKKIERIIQDWCVLKGITVGVAESCTGGLLSKRLTDISGSSDYFYGGMVSYNNSVKIKLLGVKKTTLVRYGAVSDRTACEMALGVCKEMSVDIGVSITGIAGPSGATKTKPVGTVYIGIVVKKKVTSQKYRFTGTRTQIREKAVSAALKLLKKVVSVWV
ncbi:MAG: nicotinamide-nucleotide amidohydrolase family protein [Candidatus Ancaeobacter aquaticus]|nr:nicotinamide-nucleotide amidohydrolase family protein [Candidatus Ancaeobacter aquaticus]